MTDEQIRTRARELTMVIRTLALSCGAPRIEQIEQEVYQYIQPVHQGLDAALRALAHKDKRIEYLETRLVAREGELLEAQRESPDDTLRASLDTQVTTARAAVAAMEQTLASTEEARAAAVAQSAANLKGLNDWRGWVIARLEEGDAPPEIPYADLGDTDLRQALLGRMLRMGAPAAEELGRWRTWADGVVGAPPSLGEYQDARQRRDLDESIFRRQQREDGLHRQLQMLREEITEVRSACRPPLPDGLGDVLRVRQLKIRLQQLQATPARGRIDALEAENRQLKAGAPDMELRRYAREALGAFAEGNLLTVARAMGRMESALEAPVSPAPWQHAARTMALAATLEEFVAWVQAYPLDTLTETVTDLTALLARAQAALAIPGEAPQP